MIGFYDYTVVLTYLSLVSSIFGMTQVIDGHFRTAILCLALSGLLDIFDGKVARTKKNRTADQKLFGVQIDSLCDVVCFGIFPALFCYFLGVRGLLGIIAISYYGVCSVIRLAFFNVLETNRQATENGANKFYHGLPITTMSIVLPLLYLLNFAITEDAFKWILFATLFAIGTLFIVDFKLRKPNNAQLTAMVIVVAIAVIIILLFSRAYKIDFKPIIEHNLMNLLK